MHLSALLRPAWLEIVTVQRTNPTSMNQLLQSCHHPHQAQVQRRSRQVLWRPCPDLPWRSIRFTNKVMHVAILKIWISRYTPVPSDWQPRNPACGIYFPTENGFFRFARSLISKVLNCREASLRSSLSKHFLSSQKARRSTTLPSWRISCGDFILRQGCLDRNYTIDCLYWAYAHEGDVQPVQSKAQTFCKFIIKCQLPPVLGTCLLPWLG